MKTCNRCGATKPLAEFYPHPQTADGYLSFCKGCVRTQQARHRNLHRAAYQARDRAYYERTKPPRRRRLLSPDERRVRLRERLRDSKARRKGAEGRWRPETVPLLWVLQEGRCFWCDAALDYHRADHHRFHVDHIIPLAHDGTNWPGNLALSCPHCNWSRNHRLPLKS